MSLSPIEIGDLVTLGNAGDWPPFNADADSHSPLPTGVLFEVTSVHSPFIGISKVGGVWRTATVHMMYVSHVTPKAERPEYFAFIDETEYRILKYNHARNRYEFQANICLNVPPSELEKAVEYLKANPLTPEESSAITKSYYYES